MQLLNLKLNQSASELIKIMVTEPWDKTISNPIGSLAERPVTDITDKIADQQQIAWDLDEFNKRVAVYSYEKPFRKGINELNFHLLETFVNDIISIPQYGDKLGKEFLENITFNWLLNNYIGKINSLNFIDYLDKCVVESVNIYKFLFPIYNLEIEKPFTLGFTEINWFRADWINDCESKIAAVDPDLMESENLIDLFQKYDIVPGIALAQITIEAESEKAELLAIEHVTNSLNCLKLYSETIVLPGRSASFGIFSMIDFNKISSYLVENISGEFSLSLSVKNQLGSLHFKTQMINHLVVYYFPKATSFLITRKSSIMNALVLQGINLMGTALSKKDIYERIILLFTIVESIFVPDSKENDIAQTSRSNLCWYMFTEMRERNKQLEIVKGIYDIRHKYVHKAIKLPIDFKKLVIFQMLIANTLIRLMDEVKIYETKDKLIMKIKSLKSA